MCGLKEIKEWAEKNKGVIGFGFGMAIMAGLNIITGKIREPKEGTIQFTRNENTGHIYGRTYVKNRFGKERRLASIDYGSDENGGLFKDVYDDVTKIMYPGD